MKGKVLRKTLAAALALLLVSGNIPLKPVTDLFSGAAITASAEGETSNQCGENATWEFDGATGTLTISGTGKMNDYEYGTQPWFHDRTHITSVVIENGITSIGSNAFEGCRIMTSVSIPDSVKSIGAYAFGGCESLTSITIPGSVTSIGESAFSGCDGLTSITIPDGVTSIGFQTFALCEGLTSIEIPDSVTSIGDGAFYDCTGLTSITIPKNVTSIDVDAFRNCTGITDVYCYADPANLKWNEGGRNDFILPQNSKKTVCHVPAEYLDKYNSPNFVDVNVTFKAEAMGECGDHATWFFDPDTHTLTISGTGAMNDYEYGTQPWFAYKDNITSVVIENGITSIGNNSFGNFSNLTSVSIPDSVKSIGADAFYGCKVLTSITIPQNVTSIGDSAFRDCTVLTSVKIPDGVTSIGSLTFDSCEGLKSIEIPDSVTSIGDYAFSDCTSLTSITIPDSVTSIGKDAFCGCTGITDVYCYADPANLKWNEDGCDDFKDDGSTVCHVPKNYYLEYVKKFGDSVNVTFNTDAPHGQCGDHATWFFDPDTNKLTISGTGAMYEYGGTMPWNNYIYDITSVVIENGITSIGNSAFNSCAKLTSVSIPDSVKSIGENAFYLCIDLTSITIPDSVESIGNRAFQACTSLTSITIPKNVTSIGADAFRGCTGITDVYCKADPDTLTWDELGRNDFMLPQNSGTTVCHVPAEYLDKYNSSKFSDVNVRFVGDLVDMGLGEHLYGHSITLDGSIGVNFYVELTDELLASDTAAMVFTVPSGTKTETQTLLVKDVIAQGSNKVVIGGKTYYKFKCSVSAKDMASPITAQLVDGDKSGNEYTYSVKDYADYLLTHAEENEEYANAAQLVKTMLSYGAYSQKLFGEGTPLADSYKGDVIGVDIPATFKYNAVKTSLPENVTLDGATLSLKSETTLSLYFKGLPQDTKFTCGGKTVETAKNGEYVIARIRGIKADELESSFTVTFTGGSVEYSPMTYCYNVLSGGSTDGNLQNVCKALYQYAQAANEYFGGNN